jgi:succinoglycan biosynthesis transport protein ExoP
MPTTQETDSEDKPHPGLSGPSILRTIWKRKIRIAAAWLLFGTALVVAVRLLPAVYLSESVVLIDSQKIPEKFVSATVASDLEDRIGAIRQLLLSSGELKKIIDDFGLYRAQRKTLVEEEILDMMRKDISITLEAVGAGGTSKNGRTGAFRIGYQGPDPVVVTRVANRLTDLYVDQNLKTRETQAAGTSDFLQTQLTEAKKRLDELEGAVSAYKLQHNGELPQQEQSLAGALSRLQTELEANRDAINRAQQTRVILEGNLAATEATLEAQTHAWEQAQKASGDSGDVTGIAQPQRKGSEVLQQQLDVLRARYKENHPDVVRLQREIETLKQAEEQSAKSAEPEKGPMQGPAGGTRPRVSQVQPVEFAHTRQQVTSLQVQIKASDKELADRQAEQQRILHDLAAYQARLEKLPVREQEMASIGRDYEISKENYKSLLDKRLAAEMALDMERRQQSERFTVVDRAQVPEKPIKPNKSLIYSLGSAAALMLALLLGMAAELRQDVLLGEWELPEGTPVLARLPLIDVTFHSEARPADWRRWFRRDKRLADAGAA